MVFMARQVAPMFIGSVVRLSTTTTLSRLGTSCRSAMPGPFMS